ncbi:MAG: hypothetical protein PHU14_11280 [Methylovulum sp.]|nr:hypothetical protein [Methylovulum sp.]
MKKIRTLLVSFALIIGAFVAFYIVYTMYFDHFPDIRARTNAASDMPEEYAKWGTFGDYVGGILNPIFSFLALMALLWTINLQIKQLEISEQGLNDSREELELTRIELTKTAAAANKQAEHFEKEPKRIDIYRIIEKLAKRIEENCKEEGKISNSSILGNYKTSINFVLKHDQCVDILKTAGGRVHFLPMIKSIESDLIQLR